MAIDEPRIGSRMGSAIRGRTTAALLAVVTLVTGCKRVEQTVTKIIPAPSPVATPLPTPTPSPTPIYVPWKRMETARLFNGIELHTTFTSEPADGTATVERNDRSSYTLDLQLHVRVPRPNTKLDELSAINGLLPKTLPGLAALLNTAHVSPFYETLYRAKLQSVQQNLARLDQLLSRHDVYDCETVLELQQPDTKRRVLLLQSDMDVDSDGSDADRVPDVDGSSATFQPMTNYKWPKRAQTPNPFLASREEKLKQLEYDLAVKPLGAPQKEQLRNTIGAMRYEVTQLKTNSFLVAAADPYVVLPNSLLSLRGSPFTPALGDYCVVIYRNTLYPAIIGDIGPNNKLGEASLRIAQEINQRATAENRPVSALQVTYLVFPGTAEKPFAPPDLDKWYASCQGLLNEIGGFDGELHAWENLIKPPPTPTPSPSPTASPASPAVSATSSPVISPTASPARTGTSAGYAR